jgi:Dehydrogenases with different specificities (related to short-chain alcohol dehydrogenases)
MPVHSIHAFAEKVVLVTDGTTPIGRAVALQLALLGAYVIVGYSDAVEEAERALEELKSLGTLANAVKADLKTAEGARALVGEIEKLYGRLDLLVHTLKSEPVASFLETSEEIWQTTMDANLKSVFFVTQAAFPLMHSRPKPSIVTVVSEFEKAEKNPAFAAAGSAVVGIVKQLSRQLPKNFRINCVAVEEGGEETNENELFKTTTGVSPDDAARAVLYLLSSEAKALNGQVLTVGKR